jgi:hypothetical protein
MPSPGRESILRSRSFSRVSSFQAMTARTSSRPSTEPISESAPVAGTPRESIRPA